MYSDGGGCRCDNATDVDVFDSCRQRRDGEVTACTLSSHQEWRNAILWWCRSSYSELLVGMCSNFLTCSIVLTPFDKFMDVWCHREWIVAMFVVVLTPFDEFMDTMSPWRILLDGMGVVCEARSHHGVFDATRMWIDCTGWYGCCLWSVQSPWC